MKEKCNHCDEIFYELTEVATIQNTGYCIECLGKSK